MGSKKLPTLPPKSGRFQAPKPDFPSYGLPPIDIAQRLATRYRWRHDGSFVAVPYEVWAELADFYWTTYGHGGPPTTCSDPGGAHQMADKPDALPLHTDAELSAMEPRQVFSKPMRTATVWIYPKV